jgi:hypothetical protein
MCLRFSNDSISPPERFAAIAAAFAANFEGIVIPSPDAGWGIPANAHAVLTENFSDADGHPTRHARDRVVAFLKDVAADLIQLRCLLVDIDIEFDAEQ